MRHATSDPAAQVEERLRQLEAEWDTDRAIELEAATTGLIGLLLGSWPKPRFLALPAFVAIGMIAAPPRPAQLARDPRVERVLQTNASVLVLTGLALGIGVDRRFLLLPAAVFSFFAQHALQGWCPPVPVLRRLGIGTMREIERERYALQALRCDFDAVPRADQAETGDRVRAALRAVDA